MQYTLEQQETMNIALRKMGKTGKVLAERDMKMALEAEAPFADIMKIAEKASAAGVKPTKPVAMVPPPPSRNALTTKWRAFAKEVSDMEPDVIDSMGRGDLIKVLTADGIISD